jgi:hypothetical protein
VAVSQLGTLVSTNGSSTSTTVTLTAPSGITVGDFLLAWFTTGSPTTGGVPGASPSGWTQIAAVNNGTGNYAYWKIATSADTTTPSYAWTGLSIASYYYGSITRFSGVNATTPIDVAAASVTSTVSGTSGTITVPAITTVTANAYIVGGAAEDDNSNVMGGATTPTWPAGWAAITASPAAAQSAHMANLFAQGAQAAAGASTSPTITVSASYSSFAANAWQVALRPTSNNAFNKTPADGEDLTDAASSVQAVQRAAADSEPLTDVVVSALNHFVTAADTAGLTDAGAGVREYRAGDVAALTDTVTVVQNRHLTAADTVGLTDAGGNGTDVNADPDIGRLPDNTIIAILTRPDITNYQFMVEAEPWCPFGEGQAINVSKFDQGTAATRNQDVPGGMQDVMTFGTDRRTPAAWTWEMFTDAGTPDVNVNEGWVDALAQVWDSDVRRSPNGAIAVRYCIGGRIRRVYGRPRRWTPIPDAIQHGKIHITADFQLSEDMVFYDDQQQNLTVQLSSTTLTGTGFKFPITFPTVMATVANPQVGQLIIGGTQKTWVTLTFNGPVNNPWVQIGTQRWSLNGVIAAGDSVSLSGRPWDMGVWGADGSALPGLLDPRARLSQLRLAPGIYPVTYGGFATTSSSTCAITWRNAYRSL